jgi:hypothetical protein
MADRTPAESEAALYMKQQSMLRHNPDGTVTTVSLDPESAEWAEELDALNPGASVLGEGFSRSKDRFERLQRYEAHLQKMHRSRNELERRQYARASDSMPYAVSRMRPIKIENALGPRQLNPSGVRPTEISTPSDNAATAKGSCEAELPALLQWEATVDAGYAEEPRLDRSSDQKAQLSSTDQAALVEEEALRPEFNDVPQQIPKVVVARTDASSERSPDTQRRSSPSSSSSSSSRSQRPKNTTNRGRRHLPRKTAGAGAKRRRKV